MFGAFCCVVCVVIGIMIYQNQQVRCLCSSGICHPCFHLPSKVAGFVCVCVCVCSKSDQKNIINSETYWLQIFRESFKLLKAGFRLDFVYWRKKICFYSLEMSKFCRFYYCYYIYILIKNKFLFRKTQERDSTKE